MSLRMTKTPHLASQFTLLLVVGFYVENLKMDFGGRFEVAVHIAFYRSNFLTRA